MKKMIAMAMAASMILTSAGSFAAAQETELVPEELMKSSTLVLETELETEGETAPGTEDAGTETEAVTEAQTGEETEAETEADLAEGMPEYRALDYVTLGEYKGLTVELEPLDEITDEAVDSAVNANLLQALDDGTIPALEEGNVQIGDVANIDYEGTLDGVAFDGGTAQAYDLEIGSGRFIEGFEDGLVEMAIGEEKDLNLTFPENYHSEDLAGKEVVFHVKVNSIKRPELTDETAALLAEGSTAEEYREHVRGDLEKSAEEQRRNNATVELLNQVFANAQIDGYPTDVFEYEFALMKKYYETMAAYYGITLEDFLEMYGTTEDALREMQRSSLSQEMVLIAVAEQEGIEIDDEAYEEGVAKYAAGVGATVEQFKEQYDKSYICNSLMLDAAIEFLTDHANFVEADAEAVSEAEAASETEAVSEAETASETEAPAGEETTEADSGAETENKEA